MKYDHNDILSGFTLIEVLLVNALIVIVVFGTMTFWNAMLRNYDYSVTQSRLTEDADLAVRQISTELRETEQGMQGAYPLEVLQNNEIAFYSDVNNDGLVERVHYWIAGGTLRRGIVNPAGNPYLYDLASEQSKVMVSDLAAPGTSLFTYFNGNWPQDTANNPLPVAQRPSATRLIKTSITVALKDTGGTASHSAEETVELRNLKDNQ